MGKGLKLELDEDLRKSLFDAVLDKIHGNMMPDLYNSVDEIEIKEFEIWCVVETRGISMEVVKKK